MGFHAVKNNAGGEYQLTTFALLSFWPFADNHYLKCKLSNDVTKSSFFENKDYSMSIMELIRQHREALTAFKAL